MNRRLYPKPQLGLGKTEFFDLTAAVMAWGVAED
jgi:hypothetical protein